MKKKNMIQIISLVLCLVLVPSMIIFAETGEHVHNDTCQHRIVDDIDEYLAQLNAGLIIPTNTLTLTERMFKKPLSFTVCKE